MVPLFTRNTPAFDPAAGSAAFTAPPARVSRMPSRCMYPATSIDPPRWSSSALPLIPPNPSDAPAATAICPQFVSFPPCTFRFPPPARA